MENYFKSLDSYLNKNVDAELIFKVIIITTILECLWERYLCYRQHRMYKKHTILPNELIGIIQKATFEKARLYAIDKSNYSIISDFFSTGLSLFILYTNGYAFMWRIAGNLVAFFGYEPKDNEVLQGGGFIFIMQLLSFITTIPFSAYFNFVIEEKHGFNKQTPLFFIKDKIKSFILIVLFGCPIAMAITWIVHIGGKYFFVYLWAFCVVVSVLFMTIYMDFIAPLFDKYKPLPEGELRTKIEQLASSINFPLKKVYVVEGSKRSSHSNAFFYGFFNNKRIVLFDTLLKDNEENNTKGCSDNEIIAVLGHELGHWKLNHVLKNILLVQVNTFLIFVLFGLLFKFQPMYAAFGFEDSAPVLVGLYTLMQYILTPYFQLLGWFMALISRNFEFAADRFAKNLGRGYALRSALTKLSADNLGFPIYDPLYSSWHNSHPPLLERLDALDKTD